MKNTSELMDKYDSVIKYQRSNGLRERDNIKPDGSGHYIPHHAIIT